MMPIRIAILTVSDRCSRGEAVDTSGPALVELARNKLAATIAATACVPDDRAAIAQQLTAWTDAADAPDLVLTTGGTGLSARDVTPEATREILHRPHAGLLELVRKRCGEIKPLAYLSRGEAGVRHATLIINFPGSRRGATESLEALLDVLPHAIAILRGDITDHGRAGDAPSGADGGRIGK